MTKKRAYHGRKYWAMKWRLVLQNGGELQLADSQDYESFRRVTLISRTEFSESPLDETKHDIDSTSMWCLTHANPPMILAIPKGNGVFKKPESWKEMKEYDEKQFLRQARGAKASAQRIEGPCRMDNRLRPVKVTVLTDGSA